MNILMNMPVITGNQRNKKPLLVQGLFARGLMINGK